MQTVVLVKRFPKRNSTVLFCESFEVGVTKINCRYDVKLCGVLARSEGPSPRNVGNDDVYRG